MPKRKRGSYVREEYMLYMHSDLLK